MVKIGVVGCGYWGPNLVRNFMEQADSSVVAVCDKRAERLDFIKRKYPTVDVYQSHNELVNRTDLDAVAIATPVYTHYKIAMEAIKAGKHVLVEKPMASNVDECSRMIDEAEKRGIIFLVDHTFVFTGAVRKMRELVETRDLGKLYYYDSTRINLGLFQPDVSVLWDLAVHDLSIMDFVVNKRALAVSATGIRHVPDKPENIAYLTVFSEEDFISHINVSWLAPVKVRLTLLGGSKKMVVYNDLEPSEKIKVYDSGITVKNDSESIYKTMIGYRTGDMWSPKIDGAEALGELARHFLACIEKKEKPVTSGLMGMRIVKLLEAATKSMADRGRVVEL